jgi:hypothetical protein
MAKLLLKIYFNLFSVLSTEFGKEMGEFLLERYLPLEKTGFSGILIGKGLRFRYPFQELQIPTYPDSIGVKYISGR